MGFINKMFGGESGYQAGVVNNDGTTNYAASSPVVSAASAAQADQAFQSGQAIGGQQYNYAAAQTPGATNALGAQSTLLGQWMAAANGQGPNPALEQLHQTTNANNAQAAGMIAGQRGINPAMALRLISQNAAATNQAAAGQAAVQGAQQQIAARQAAGQIAAQQVGQYGDAIAGARAGNLQQQQITQGAIANQNNANVSRANAVDTVNSGTAAANAANEQKTTGGIIGGIGAAMGMADGGEVPNYVQGADDPLRMPWSQAPEIHIPEGFQGLVATPYASGSAPGPWSADAAPTSAAADDKGWVASRSLGRGLSEAGSRLASDPILGISSQPAMTGPWDIANTVMQSKSEGGEIGPSSALGKKMRERARSMANGGKVPGQAAVAGDSRANDRVAAALSPGEFVIKRTVAQMPGMKEALEAINSSPAAARSFVQHLVARKGAGFEKVVKARGGAKAVA